MGTSTQPSTSHAAANRSKYVTVREFADHWGCSMRTVHRDIGKGALPVERTGVGRRRIRILRTVMESYGELK
jgi:hypothetical protein